ncbi:MAG: potassium channel family protein [Verrucomicrobiota bacterium]
MTSISQIRHKAVLLLVAELVLIASSPSWAHLEQLWLALVFPVFFAACASVLANSKKALVPYIILALTSLVAEWLVVSPFSSLAQLFCHGGASFYLFREVLKHSFFRSGVPYADRLIAGVSGYLLLGIFSFIFSSVLQQFQPGAYLDQITSEPPVIADQLYFSFMTLTTVGYGDIVPRTPFAKVLVTLTSLSGVLYLAVFISVLVSRKAPAIREQGVQLPK